MGFYDARAAFRRGEMKTAKSASQQELIRARAAGDTQGEVSALCMLARVALRVGDMSLAAGPAAEARSQARIARDMWLEREPVHLLAGLARMSGDLAGARSLHHEGIVMIHAFGKARMLVPERYSLGFVELRSGRVNLARDLFALAREGTFHWGLASTVPVAVLSSADMASAEADDRRAVQCRAVLGRVLAESFQLLDPDDAAEEKALRAHSIRCLGQQAFDVEYTAGTELELASCRRVNHAGLAARPRSPAHPGRCGR
jgi:hypothetical protein